MSILQRTDGWTVERVGETLVFEFTDEMDSSEFGEAAWDAYTERLGADDIDSVVTVVDTTEPFDAGTFDVWARSGEVAVQHGVEQWAVVGDQLKRMSTTSQLRRPGLHVEGFDTREAAVEWAREGGTA